MKFKRLSHNVIVIPGLNPGPYTLDGTNTYLIGTGSPRILIDSGQGVEFYLSNLKDCLLSEGNCVISQLLITHHHHDHIGGIQQVKSLFPNLKIHKFLTENEANTDYQNISDGEEFSVDGAALKAIYTPGHTDDHMSFFLMEDKSVFTGDCILGQGTAVFTDLRLLMNSFQKLKSLTPQRLYCGHGPVVLDGIRKIIEYANHREQRNGQIMHELRNGGALEIEQIVDRIYVDFPKNLKTMAIGSVKQHLKYLEQCDMVVEKMNKWVKKK